MQITKYVHSCLLVETPDRVALFDPGAMSIDSIPLDQIEQLDDIIITHVHPDHFVPDFIKQVVQKFPGVMITATSEVVAALGREGITATDQPSAAIEFFDAPHENVQPVYPQPENVGIHYLEVLTDPGDSHSFDSSLPVLAMPITAPWGGSIAALNVILQLKPQHVIPIHDWHWNDAARAQTYDHYAHICAERGIAFHKPETGKPLTIDV